MTKRIGELLMEFQLLTKSELDEAIEIQKRTGEKLGDIIIRRGFVNSEDFEQLLSRQLSVPSISLRQYTISPDVLKLVPEKFMRKKLVLPVELSNNVLTVAMANPKDFATVDELRFMVGKRIAPVLSSTAELTRKLREIFPSSGKWEEALETGTQQPQLEYITPLADSREENLEEQLEAAAQDAPTVKIVNSVILAALSKNATHIHLEPHEKTMDVKLRINGLLEKIYAAPKDQARNLLIRLKILAGIDILKRRVPLEGYFRVRSEDKYYDIDLYTFPVHDGEHAVLAFQQLFSKEDLRLENLGMSPELFAQYQSVVEGNRGLLIVVGPPDSGKSSTLYATMNLLKNPTRRTVTYENPIKNRLADIEQAEPNPRAGLTYDAGLRALIRQDVDTLMVGDFSSRDTVQASLDAALGKTLVLARMVFNNTMGVIPRILDQGIPPFLLYSALRGILGQRLVRRLCSNCLESFEPPELVRLEIAQLTGKDNPKLYRAQGCKLCGNTGYRGRIGIFELLVPDRKIQSLILSRGSQEEILQAAQSLRFRNLAFDGLLKAVDGLTTYEEVQGAI